MHEYEPRQMQASTVGTKYGPGPFLARTKRKNAEPKKMKTAMMMEGYANRNGRLKTRLLIMKLKYHNAPQPRYTVRSQLPGV